MNENQDQAFVSTHEFTALERLCQKMFPAIHLDAPLPPEGHTARDCIVIRIEIRFSFMHRLKLLLTGRFMVETKTATENIIGGHVTASTGYPMPPKFMEVK